MKIARCTRRPAIAPRQHRPRGVPAHYEYAPFGAVTAATTNAAFTAFNVAEINPFRFSSEYVDDALGLVYYNYRHYEPVTGRWMSRDIVDETIELHLYMALHNALRIDCLGLILFPPIVISPPPETIGIEPLPKPAGEAHVSRFGDMLEAAINRRATLVAQSGSYINVRLTEELVAIVKSRIKESVVDCGEANLSVRGKIGEGVKYGGELFSLGHKYGNSWGPMNYNFWTVGTARTNVKWIGNGVRMSYYAIGACCLCSYSFTVNVDGKVTDRFDFVPDRPWDSLSSAFYNVVAFPFSFVFNDFVGASRPDLEIPIHAAFTFESSFLKCTRWAW